MKKSAQKQQPKISPKGKGKQTSLMSFFTPKSAILSGTGIGTPPVPVPSSVEKRGMSDNEEEDASPVKHKKRNFTLTINEDEDENMEPAQNLNDQQRTPAKKANQNNSNSTQNDDIENNSLISKNSMAVAITPTQKTPIDLSAFSAFSSSFKTPSNQILSTPAGFVFTSPKTGGSVSKKKSEVRFAWLDEIRDAEKRLPIDPDYDKRTLFIPPSAWRVFTPFEKQFWEIKSKHWDTVVFFKKGKFYELYENDAEIGHQQFDLKLTDRVNMKMVGVPESSFDYWASQFIAKGHKVAKVDQMENAVGKSIREKGSSVKKDQLIRRELTCILTAGTLVDAGLLTSVMSTFCMSIKEQISNEHSVPSFGVCFVDTSTAEFHICSFSDDNNRTKLETLLLQIKPRELVIEKLKLSKQTLRMIKNSSSDLIINSLIPEKEFWTGQMTIDEIRAARYFKPADAMETDQSNDDFDNWPECLKSFKHDDLGISAMGGLISYLRSIKIDNDMVSTRNFHLYDPIKQSGTLILDGQTLLNLEIFENTMDGSDTGTLFSLLNHCTTAFGKRLFKRWLCHPLKSIEAINDRFNAVDDLDNIRGVSNSLLSLLSDLPDLERVISRIHSGTSKVKEFVSALGALERIHLAFKEAEPFIKDLSSTRLARIFAHGFPEPLYDALKQFKMSFDHQKAMQDEKIIPSPGFDEEFELAQERVYQIEKKMEIYRRKIAQELNCSDVQYKDIGKEIYQIEVSIKTKVPKDWQQMSKTQTVHRYWTRTIQDYVKDIMEAREMRDETLRTLKLRIFAKFDENYSAWLDVIRNIAELDCLLSLFTCKSVLGSPSCRPEFVEGTNSLLELEELRHPCIMQGMNNAFIPNDTSLGGEDGLKNMILLTGPNMGGKSTLLRQTCLAVIMAQLGCHVPASKCRLTPVDRIFTRIGASDNILAGQSTFMVELAETSKILSEATSNSLVILDELGRGTSTFDGYAIAFAVLHHLINNVRCLGLFSTHYATLTKEFEHNPLVAMYYMGFFRRY